MNVEDGLPVALLVVLALLLAQAFEAIQSVYTTAASRAATRSPAPVYCPIRVVIMVHTQLTLLHYSD